MTQIRGAHQHRLSGPWMRTSAEAFRQLLAYHHGPSLPSGLLGAPLRGIPLHTPHTQLQQMVLPPACKSPRETSWVTQTLIQMGYDTKLISVITKQFHLKK